MDIFYNGLISHQMLIYPRVVLLFLLLCHIFKLTLYITFLKLEYFLRPIFRSAPKRGLKNDFFFTF